MRLTINTDDPGVFQTTSPTEFDRIGQGYLDRGYTVQEVDRWLDDARQTACDACLIRRHLARGAALADLIRETLDADGWRRYRAAGDA